MKVSGIRLAILICALVLISGVSAQNVGNNAGYGVTPAGSMYLPQVLSPMTVGTITTGKTDWYATSVSPGKTSITTDLNWGYTPDSLTLTVIAPDGTLGPYHDADDGVKDGRIFLTFSRTSGIAPGTWNFKVYGENVLGSQSYKFVSY
jgi:hypothetical protein